MSLLTRITEGSEVNKDGTIAAGVFIPLPPKLAAKFPDKDVEDDSPPHLTLLYLGNISKSDQTKVERAVRQVARQLNPFMMQLNRYAEFQNPKGQTIAHMTGDAELAGGLAGLHGKLWNAVKAAGVSVEHGYGGNGGKRRDVPRPDLFKTHATLQYVNDGAKYVGAKPTGEWKVDVLEVWGHRKTKIKLGASAEEWVASGMPSNVRIRLAARDFPSKYAGPVSPSNRTGIGSAPVEDPRHTLPKRRRLKTVRRRSAHG